MKECPACGLFLEKWEAVQARKSAQIASAQSVPVARKETRFRNTVWNRRMVAGAIAGLLTLALYWRHYASSRRLPRGEATGETAEFRDSKTGTVRYLPIRTAVPPP